MKKEQKKSWKTVLVMLVVVVVVICAFLYVRSQTKEERGKEAMTEVEKLLDHDLEANYPGNAREVIRFYNRLLTCFYNEELSDEELKGLAGQVRVLFDTELLKRNPIDTYIENLEADIAAYKIAERTIINIALQDYEDVKFETKGEDEIASLLSYYLMREKTGNRKSYLRYYLREDEEGKWRILFWELTEESF